MDLQRFQNRDKNKHEFKNSLSKIFTPLGCTGQFSKTEGTKGSIHCDVKDKDILQEKVELVHCW